jgi:hypothetical protein
MLLTRATLAFRLLHRARPFNCTFTLARNVHTHLRGYEHTRPQVHVHLLSAPPLCFIEFYSVSLTRANLSNTHNPRYTCICVPPLPDKAFNPKFGETADEKRREKLERWLRRVMAHPVLRQDKLSLQHFLQTNYAQVPPPPPMFHSCSTVSYLC